MSEHARVVEALLFTASEPLDAKTIATCAGIGEPDVEEALAVLGERHAQGDRKSTRLNSSHVSESRMPSSA